MSVRPSDPTSRRRVGGWFVRMPRGLRTLLGAVAVALGAVLLVRPTSSIGVLAWLIGAGLIVAGIVELSEATDRAGARPTAGWDRWHLARAVVWLLAGLLVLLLPGLTMRLLALAVGIGLVVNGVISIASGFRQRTTLDVRITRVALGAAEVVFGVLAMAWPDITLLVVGVVFGARLVMIGLVTVWSAFRGASSEPRDSLVAPGFVRRWTRTITAVIVLAVSLGAAALSAALHDGSPVVDAFYAAPRHVPSEPGQLVRAESFTRDIPDDATAWRILYTTTRGDGSPAVASGLVVAPREGTGPWPVIDWTHGTTGYAENCAPSLAKQPFESGAFFLLDRVIDNGWALVATDYIGLGTAGPHPYLIGPDTAHAALDAARAARQLDEANLGDQNVVWGHSQGGGAALWTGALADQYAPELDIEGIAALAPASNLPALVESLPNVTGGSVFASFVFAAYSAVYDDVNYRDYIRPGAEVTVREMTKRCLAEPGVLVSVLNALVLSKDPEIFARDPLSGALGEHLTDNVPPATISAPILLAQGGSDRLIIRSAQDEYVDGLCADGQQLDYRIYQGRGHVPLVEPDSPLVPQLLDWTRDRLDGKAVAPDCTRSED